MQRGGTAEFLSYVASVFTFSSLLPEGVSLFVHRLRQILVMSEQLLALTGGCLLRAAAFERVIQCVS